MADIDALVVGAGVSGLTTGVCLAEAGRRVRIRTAAPPAETTSAVAGALWEPYLVEAGGRVWEWCRATLSWHAGLLCCRRCGGAHEAGGARSQTLPRRLIYRQLARPIDAGGSGG